MKTFYLPSYGRIAALCLFSLLSVPSFAQKSSNDDNQKLNEKLSTFDLSFLKSELFLNKSIFTTDEIDFYRRKPQNKKGQTVITTTAEEWEMLYERLALSDVNEKNKLPRSKAFIPENRVAKTTSNTISIGILNLDGILLTEAQLKENTKQKLEGKKADANRYERIFFFAASVLQEDVFQADVTFRIDPALHFSNNGNQIKHIDIDFQDGKGFRPFGFKEQGIAHRFTAEGEQALVLRILTNRGTFFCHTKVNIRQLERPQAFRNFTLQATEARPDTITPAAAKSGRTAISVPGANVRILLGCDGVFDRPLIVAEGFDIGQDVSLDDIQAEYFNRLTPFRTAGYDLVLLDYWDARSYLENNANVFIALINEVNQTKQGNFPLTVIGESMSGLIARYALRTMENNGQAHNVSHFISFDSPHQGANLPVGLLELYWNASRSASILSLTAALLINPVRNYFLALQTPAAAQLLRHYGGPFGPGAPHPEFVAFQQTLQNLGYPQQCANLSVISGSQDASDIMTRAGVAPGDLIMNSFTPYVLQNTFVQVRTNNPNNNTVVLDFVAIGILLNHASLTTCNNSLNDDFLPGGHVEVPYNIDEARTAFQPAFVPTFSSIDFQGPRNEQGQRQNLNVQTARANGQTPFLQIFGTASNRNEPHARAGFINWTNVAGFITNRDGVTLNNCPVPPTPSFSTTYFIPCVPNNIFPSYAVTALLNDPTNYPQYDETWSVSPGAYFTYNSDGISLPLASLSPGLYTVTVTRRQNNVPNPQEIAFSQTFYVCSSSPDDACGFSDGNFLVQLNGSDETVFARYSGGTLFAAAESGNFVSRSVLANTGFPASYLNCFAESDPRGPSNLPLAAGCYTLKAKHSNKFIQPENNNAGARLRQYDANGQTNQIFRLDVVDGNAYKITSVLNNIAVEAAVAGTAYETPVRLESYRGGNHQKWDITPWGDGSYKLTPKHFSVLLFDIEGTYVDNGAGVHLWGQHGGDNQRFFIQSSSCTSGPPPPPTTACTINRVRFKFRNVGDCCMDRLQGARIQGSNDQSNWTDLHTFTENGTGDWQEKTFTGGNYQHVRFVAGQNGYGELYELEFYNGNTKLNGTSFGSVGGDGSTGYTAAFDGNTGTQWHGGASGSQNVAGLSLTGCGSGCSAPVPGIAGGGNVCNGQTVTLTASGCSGTYRWSNGTNGTASITVGAGTYSVTCEQGGCTSGASGQVTVTANCGGGNQPLANGCYTLKAKHSNKFIQPETANGGARLRQYDGNGQTTQIFNLEWVDNNAYRINSQSASKAVEAAGAGTGNATPVVLGDWSNGTHQKWNVEAWGDGTYKLSPRNASGKLFDIEGTSVANGAGVHLWDQHGGNNQRYFIESTGCSSGPPPTGCTVNKVRFRFRNVGDCCMDRLQGARIQGSTDQSNWVDLHTFTENGTGDWQEKTFSGGAYQYVRFLAGNTGYGELHELEFYNGGTKLNGTPFGTAGTDGSNGYGAAFDGNTATQWHGTFPGTNNHAGLHLSCGGGGRLGVEGALTGQTEPGGSLLLVPNPATDYVELRLTTGEEVRRAVCYDTQGRALIETSQARLFTGRLVPGTYLIRVETKAGRTYSRMLVKM